jgi:hypothetical protein
MLLDVLGFMTIILITVLTSEPVNGSLRLLGEF